MVKNTRFFTTFSNFVPYFQNQTTDSFILPKFEYLSFIAEYIAKLFFCQNQDINLQNVHCAQSLAKLRYT